MTKLRPRLDASATADFVHDSRHRVLRLILTQLDSTAATVS